MRSVSIVVPVFDEERNLSSLDAEIQAAASEAGGPTEVLYVDDGSRDGSLAVLAGLVREGDGSGLRRRVVKLRRNYGQTAAMAAGFDLASGDLVVALDADRQNNPADIPRMLVELEKGFDVVSGWRRSRKDKLLSRRLPSLVANWLIGLITGVRLHDYGCTLKAYRASLLKQVNLYGEMHRFIPIYLARIGARVTEIEVDHRPRTEGASKYGAGRVTRVLSDILLAYFVTRYYTRPMHFFGQVAMLFLAALGAVFLLMVAFKYGWLALIGSNYRATFIQTPLPAIAGTFLLGAVMSLFFGLLGEILVRVHYESQGLKPYAIDEVIEVPPVGEAR